MKPARPIALLLALGLAAPALAQAPAAPAAPAAVVTTAAKPAASEDVLPAGAPSDDYEFVGWCAGTLTGHMALFDQVEPTLKEISKRWNTEAADERDFAAKQVAGRDLLAQFANAMKAAENASNQAIAPRGQRAIAIGREKWAAIDSVDANSRAYSWMNWGLPERCERVAGKLKSRATLMGVALRDNSQNTIQASAVRAVGERPAEEADAAKPVAAPNATPAAKPAAATPAVAAPVKPATPATTTTVTAPTAAAAKPVTTASTTGSTKASPAAASTPAAKPAVASKPATTPTPVEKKAAPAVTPPAQAVKLRGSLTPAD